MHTESGAQYQTTYITKEEYELIEDIEGLCYSEQLRQRLMSAHAFSVTFWWKPPQICYLLDKNRNVADIEKVIQDYINERRQANA